MSKHVVMYCVLFLFLMIESEVLMRFRRIRKWLLSLSIYLSTAPFIVVSAFDINDIPAGIYKMMERDDPLTDILRKLGGFLFTWISQLLNMAESGFTKLITFDFLKASDEPQSVSSMLAPVLAHINEVIYILLFIAFVIVVVIRMFKWENALKVVYNAFMVVLVVSMFGTMFSLMDKAKNDMVELTGLVFNSGKLSASDTIFVDNTVDFKQSLIDGKVVTLADEKFDKTKLDYLDWNIRMEHDGQYGLDKYFDINVVDGKTEKQDKDLSDGLFGLGVSSYYRYKPDWLAINLISLIELIIYIYALFKCGYLVWQWLSFYVFGRIAIGKGILDVDNIGKALGQGSKTIGGFLFLYASMNLFSLLASGILHSFKGNVLAQGILLYSVGMAIITGSGFINEFMGIDDGSRSIMRSGMMSRRIGRNIRNLAVAGAGIAGAGVAGVMAAGHFAQGKYDDYRQRKEEEKESEAFSSQSPSVSDDKSFDGRSQGQDAFTDESMKNRGFDQSVGSTGSQPDFSSTTDNQASTDPQVGSLPYDEQLKSDDMSTSHRGYDQSVGADNKLEPTSQARRSGIGGNATRGFDTRKASQTKSSQSAGYSKRGYGYGYNRGYQNKNDMVGDWYFHRDNRKSTPEQIEELQNLIDNLEAEEKKG